MVVVNATRAWKICEVAWKVLILNSFASFQEIAAFSYVARFAVDVEPNRIPPR